MAVSRPYEAKKMDGSESWEIVNTETNEVMDSGLDEDTAKARARLANDLAEEAGKDDGGA